MREQSIETRKRQKLSATAAAVLTTVALSSCTDQLPPEVVTVTVTKLATPDAYPTEDGPCVPQKAFAQNRWDPIGASERREPDVLALKIGSYAGNEVIAYDGWRETLESPYPNPAPWNSKAWLHTTDGGWVWFGAVRKEPTTYDPTGHAKYGGEPVQLDPACEM